MQATNNITNIIPAGFKTTLKARRLGLWRTMEGRSFQLCAAEKQKARPPCCFRLEVGIPKVLSSEDKRRDLAVGRSGEALVETPQNTLRAGERIH